MWRASKSGYYSMTRCTCTRSKNKSSLTRVWPPTYKRAFILAVLLATRSSARMIDVLQASNTSTRGFTRDYLLTLREKERGEKVVWFFFGKICSKTRQVKKMQGKKRNSGGTRVRLRWCTNMYVCRKPRGWKFVSPTIAVIFPPLFLFTCPSVDGFFFDLFFVLFVDCPVLTSEGVFEKRSREKLQAKPKPKKTKEYDSQREGQVCSVFCSLLGRIAKGSPHKQNEAKKRRERSFSSVIPNRVVLCISFWSGGWLWHGSWQMEGWGEPGQERWTGHQRHRKRTRTSVGVENIFFSFAICVCTSHFAPSGKQVYTWSPNFLFSLLFLFFRWGKGKESGTPRTKTNQEKKI